MKKLLFIIFILFEINTYAQVVGGFTVYNDGHIYFQATNQSGYTFTVKVVASSSDRERSESWTLGPGGGFYLGPSTPWRWYWQVGDRLTVIYPNGQSAYWDCPQNDVSYIINEKGKHCTAIFGCDCPGFKPSPKNEFICDRCHHDKKYHH